MVYSFIHSYRAYLLIPGLASHCKYFSIFREEVVYRKPDEDVPVPHDAAVTRGKGPVWGRNPPHPRCWWLGAEGASRPDDGTEGWDPKPLPPLLFKPMQIIHVHTVREYFSAEFEMVKQRFVNKRLAAQSASKAVTASANPSDVAPGA